MNHLVDSPLNKTDLTKDKMQKWVESQAKGDQVKVDVYGKPTEKQLRDLENVRSLSKELQDNLHELENSVRMADADNQAMTPTAPILDYSEDHEFVSANKLDNYYSEEDKKDAKEEEMSKLTKGNGARTEIQQFYKDQCVFLTGGTGFLGKVVIEKLLRSCGDVDTIYVLVRSKKGKDAHTRLHEMLDEFLFHRAHDENPKGIHKVIPIVGDMELPGLGVSEHDRKMITSKVTIIINAAATVKFDEKLSVSTGINVKGTKEVIKLAKECRNLKALTHVSTAFSNTHVDFIEEKFYEPPMSVEALEAVSEIKEDVIDAILPSLLGKRPNTYCFTKAIAEEAVRKYAEGMPVCIIRPSIVVSTYEEPVRGWTDSLYGPTGIIIGVGTGVTIIINAAATVKFDEKLSVSTGINVKGTKEVIKLAKECRNLKALTHVSTAFSNTHVDFIEEKFYEPPMSVEALEAVSEIKEDVIDAILPSLLGKRPNTYCFTKAIAEEAVRKYAEGMPVCIIRPSIVVSTYEEPVRGWTDSLYGPTGIIIGVGTGVLRTMYMDLNKVADMVPVDMTANAILASAWHTAKNFKENQTSDIPIYNFVSGAQNPINWGQFIEVNRKYGTDKPTTKAVWYYGLSPTKNYTMFLFYNFFLHYLPAMLVDCYCALVGRRRAMLQLYSRVMRMAHILFYFSTQDWRFSDQGVQGMWAALSDEDKTVFFFSLKEMSWERLCETFLVGLRVYLIKDDLSTLPEARKKWNRLFYLHQIVKMVTLCLVLNLAYLVIKPLVSIIF